jgi:hypothetical protein
MTTLNRNERGEIWKMGAAITVGTISDELTTKTRRTQSGAAYGLKNLREFAH